MSQLVTGEAVALDLRTAGVPSRMLAALIDVTAQVVLGTGLLVLVGLASSSAATFAALSVSTIVVVGLGYPVAFETLLAGRTPGKLALGLRVVRDDGGPVGFRQAFVRGLLGLFVEKPGVTGGSAALISSLLSADGKRLGDLAAGTVVVQERVAHTSVEVMPMPPGLAGWAAGLDLSALSDGLVMSVRGFLTRYPHLTEATRASLGARLVEEVAAVVGPPPQGVPPGAFLSAVVAERRQRAERSVVSAAPPPPVLPPPPASDSPFAPPS